MLKLPYASRSRNAAKNMEIFVVPKPTAKWTFKDGYILALAPALGLFCINRYEAGRFAYLGIPSGLIDLPMPRLIGGGTAIVVLGVMLFIGLRSARKFLFADSGWRRFLGAFLLFFALVGLPFLMLSTTLNPAVWALLLTLSLAVAAGDGTKKESKETDSPDLIGLAFVSGLLVFLMYSFGFLAERITTQRMCITDQPNTFVSGFYGQRAILKSFDARTGQVLSGVELVDLGSSLRLRSCILTIRGMPSFLDQAYSKRSRRDQP